MTQKQNAPVVPGRLLDNCRIDLPLDDVVEEIEFEKFFRLTLPFGALQGDEGAQDAPPAQSRSHGKLGNPGADGTDHETGSTNVRDFRMALYMPFTQQWVLDGYTRGRIVNSFSLGPGEEQTVEIFTWDRLRNALETSSSFDSEQTTESSGSRRDTGDVSQDIARQTGFELTSGGKVGFTVGVVNVDLTAGMSARTGVNDAEKTTRTSIVDATTRSTGHVRTNRTLKVTESRESGREERVTRKLRNPNTCHTMTVPFFEILANYRVATFVRTAEVRLVMLIPSSLLSRVKTFDRHEVREHETSLRLALLDRTLAPGFDAARLLDARDRACKILCEGCSCDDDHGHDTNTKEWEVLATAALAVAQKVDVLRSTTIHFPVSVGWAVPAPVGGFGVNPVVIAAGIKDIKRYMFRKTLAAHAPRLLNDLAAPAIAGASTTVSVSQVRALASVLAALSPDALALARFDPGVYEGVSWEVYGAILLFHPEFISAGVMAGGVKAAIGGVFDDDGLLSALTTFSAAYDAWTKQQAATTQADGKLAELARIAKEERDLRILETFGLRETADAQERLQALVDHLNDRRNFDHYRFAVWNERAGGADDSVTVLALAGLIDPTPVGIVGDQLAVPVRLEHQSRWSAFFDDSLVDLVKHTVRDEHRHILPTAALYAEAVVGLCCACEDDVMDARKLDAEQHRLSNELLRLEELRLKARLAAEPPLLDKEQLQPARVEVSVLDGTTDSGGKH